MTSGNRISEWFFSKVPMLMGVAYLTGLMSGHVNLDTATTFKLLGLLMTIVGFAAIGYWVNDLFDRDSDKVVGKSNLFLNSSRSAIGVVVLGSISLAFLPWTWLHFNGSILFLLALELVLYLLYAMPPFRLKERGIIGVLTDGMYAQVVPMAVVILVIQNGDGQMIADRTWIWILLGAGLVAGIRKIIFHQLVDADQDERSGTKTFVVNAGRERTERLLLTIIEPLESVLVVLLVMLVGSSSASFGALASVVLGLIFLTNPLGEGVLRYNPLKLQIFNRILDQVAEIFLPVISLIALALLDSRFGWVLLMHVLLFMPGYMHLLQIGRYHVLGPVYHRGVLRAYYHVLIPIHSLGRWVAYNVFLRLISWCWHLGYFVQNGRWQKPESKES